MHFNRVEWRGRMQFPLLPGPQDWDQSGDPARFSTVV
jgi:hypothetical protein